METTAPLEPEERRMLARSGNRQMASYILFAIALTGSPWLPFSDAVFEYQVAASVVFAVGMTTLLYFLRRRMLEVYNTTPKQIIRGVVTNKQTERSKKSSSVSYCITVGTDEIYVEGDVYRRYQVGDSVEFHCWSGWGVFVLQHRMWNP